MGYRVGIDLGTTFSVVAYVNPETGAPEVIKNRYGEATTPSVLAFNEDGTVLFGKDAKEEKAMGNPNTASFFKRDMGNMDAEVEYWGKIYNPKDLSAILLKKLVEQAEEKLDDKIDEVVITVPAYFTNAERSATLQAGIDAGLKVSSIISEPSAAAFAYGLNSNGKKTVLIYDLGGGTFDVSIAEITDDDINIIGTAGEHQLGGKDWDASIVSWIEGKFEEQFGCEIDFDLETDALIMELAEKAKKELSSKLSTTIRFSQDGNKGQYELTRETFKDITSYQLGITKRIIDNLFSDIAKDRKGSFGWDNIDGVILVGGSTKMKMVEEYIIEKLHREPLHGVNVDEAVALGAAIRANIDNAGNALPGAVNTIGAKKGNQRSTIAGGKRIHDSTAHALGMIAENEKGSAYINSIIIRKNTNIPAEATKTHALYTSASEKNELEVYLLQGDAQNPLECLIAGKYVFRDIKHESGGAKIAVTYRYNQNGIIDVEASQKGKKLPVTIEPVPGDMSWLKEPPQRSVKSVEVDIYLIVDLSYSMKDSVYELKKVIKKFLAELNFDTTRIAMIGVANKVGVLQALTNNRKTFENALQMLDDAIENGLLGYSNKAQPFIELYNLVNRGKAERKAIGIVLADGVWDKQAVADSYKYSKICHDKGIEIVALGFGTANEKFLKDISSLKDLSALRNLNQLTENFSKIARVVGTGLRG